MRREADQLWRAHALAKNHDLHGATQPAWHDERFQREPFLGRERFESTNVWIVSPRGWLGRIHKRKQEVHLIEEPEGRTPFLFGGAADAREVHMRRKVPLSRGGQPGDRSGFGPPRLMLSKTCQRAG